MDALARLAPVSEGYATLPVAQAFTWADCSEELPPGEWYLVAFRSTRRADADEERLTAYDDRAHHEAMQARGFVHYYKGPNAPDGSCLSFCMWTGRAEARSAAGRMAHREAISIVHEMYAEYRLEFLRVTKAHSNASLEFELWDRLPDRGSVPGPLQPAPAPA